MKIDSNSIVSVTEANQNFTHVTKLADSKGSVVIFKNNRPKYILTNIEESPVIQMTEDEKFEFVARRILKKHIKAFLELAK